MFALALVSCLLTFGISFCLKCNTVTLKTRKAQLFSTRLPDMASPKTLGGKTSKYDIAKNIESERGHAFDIDSFGLSELLNVNRHSYAGDVDKYDETEAIGNELDKAVVDEREQLLWKLVVGGICFLWGTNFATIRQIFNEVPDLDPAVYAALRFGIAAVVFAPSYVGRLGDFKLVRNSFLCGLFVFTGYIGQAIGLANGSTPEKSAFIASLCVVWVPILQCMLSKDWTKQKWGSTFLAITGIAFLELEGTSPPNIGDLWSLLQPLGFGTSYILIENAGKILERDRKKRLELIEEREQQQLREMISAIPDGRGNAKKKTVARKVRSMESRAAFEKASKKAAGEDAAASTGLQIFSIALLSTCYALVEGKGIDDLVAPFQQSNVASIDLLYTGLITTALAIYAQTIVSTKVKSTDIAIILAGEPIFATAYAALILGEHVSAQDMLGGLLVIVSCLGAEVDLSHISKAQRQRAREERTKGQ